MELDVKTLFFLNVAVLFLSAVMASYFRRQYRDNGWLLWWSLGTGLCAIALLLLGAFGPVPPVAIGAPSVIALFAGYVMIWESMRVFNGSQLRLRRLVLIVVIFVGLHVALVAAGAPLSLRASLVSGGLAIFAGLSAYEVSPRVDAGFLRTRLAMAALFGAMAAVLAVRTALTLLRPQTAMTEAFYDPLEGFSALINSIGVTGLSIGLLMMANERTSDRHRRLALTDDLTGLDNRRHFLAQAGQLLRRRRNHSAACVLMMDLDHFSKVNERHGHAGGDAALAWFAKLLRQQLGGDDLVARYGGEEFCALVTGASEVEALAVAERIRAALAAQPAILRGQPHAITVSIGVAAVFGGDIEQALRKADQALYLAKAAGRNRVAGQNGLSPRADLGPIARPA